MKKHLKKILSTNPAVYGFARTALDSFRDTFGSNAETARRTKKNLGCIKQVAEVVRSLGLAGLEITGEDILMQVKDGSKFYFYPDKANPLLLIPIEGDFEPKETSFMERMIKSGDVVFDVGANFGWYAVHFSKWVGPKGQVHSFEPVGEAFEELDRNVSLNGCSDNSFLINKALGKSKGEITLYVPKELGTAFASQHNHYGEKIKSEMTTLDSYVEENKLSRVDFIKADVEGGELEVLLGAENVLDQYHPDLFLEIQEIHTERFGYFPREVFEFLSDKGYSAFYVEEKGILAPVKEFTSLPDYNFYFSANAEH